MQRRLRLRQQEDFERLRQQGRADQHRLLKISYVENGLTHNRYGFIVSKRLGKAVQRNRMRRLLRESVRLLHPQLRAGFDILMIARQPLVGQPFITIQRTVYSLLVKAGLVNKQASESETHK